MDERKDEGDKKGSFRGLTEFFSWFSGLFDYVLYHEQCHFVVFWNPGSPYFAAGIGFLEGNVFAGPDFLESIGDEDRYYSTLT